MTDTTAERLTATAIRLFQDRGFARVGIDQIVREAEVARMSLYNNFHSKEGLALAAYAALSQARQEAVDAVISAAPDPQAAILAIFDLAQTLAGRPSFRGCAFINLAAQVGSSEERLVALVRRHKAALRERFARLAAERGEPEPELLSRQLLALWDGALADAFIEGDIAPIRAARRAAEHLLTRDG